MSLFKIQWTMGALQSMSQISVNFLFESYVVMLMFVCVILENNLYLRKYSNRFNIFNFIMFYIVFQTCFYYKHYLYNQHHNLKFPFDNSNKTKTEIKKRLNSPHMFTHNKTHINIFFNKL